MVKVDVQGGIVRWREYLRRRAELKEMIDGMDIHEFQEYVRNASTKDLRRALSCGLKGDRYYIVINELYRRRIEPISRKHDHQRRRKRR